MNRKCEWYRCKTEEELKELLGRLGANDFQVEELVLHESQHRAGGEKLGYTFSHYNIHFVPPDEYEFNPHFTETPTLEDSVQIKLAPDWPSEGDRKHALIHLLLLQRDNPERASQLACSMISKLIRRAGK
jgi:hypothetical protein